LSKLDHQKIKFAFNDDRLNIFSNSYKLKEFLLKQSYSNSNLLFMSSGNYASIDLDNLINQIRISK